MTTRDIGQQGFVWFIGFVEEVASDTDQLGMIKVRVPNVHGNMPTDELPYASVMTPAQSASQLEVGISPNGILPGSMVFGFFMDGHEFNIPVVIGTIPKINQGDLTKHDVSKLARGTNSISKPQLGPEPASAYKAKYPHNKTYTTTSGHAIEIDDTPGAERIHIYHKAGTYTEINSVGRRVNKVAESGFDIVVKDETVYIGGKLNVVIKGTATLSAASWDITGDTTIHGNLKVTGDVTDHTRSMQGDRDIYNVHRHGSSPPPSPQK